jgi:hypothetical protein
MGELRKEMGMFKKKIGVSNIKDPDQFFEEEFCVDTGALYSFVPGDYLERIRVEPTTKRNLILADGRRDMRLLGFCDFQIEGFEGNIPCPVIFAPKGSLFLMGAMADVPKTLYQPYLKISEATFQSLLKNHTAGEIYHYKPIPNFSSPHKSFEGYLPCLFSTLMLTHMGQTIRNDRWGACREQRGFRGDYFYNC